MLTVVTAVIFGIFGTTESAPQGDPSLITFDKGRIGVNFLGFHAEAGLGGILTGNAADGGLYAGAGTPFGQSAQAGLGGHIDDQGRKNGGMFAGATAGNGVYAGAGLGNAPGASGAIASNGKTVIAVGDGLARPMEIDGPIPLDGPIDQDNVQVIPHKLGRVSKIHLKRSGTETLSVPSVPATSSLKKEVDIYPELDLDVREKLFIPPPPPPPPSTVYIEKTKFKARRRPHFRKHVIISKSGYDGLEGPPPAELGLSGEAGLGVYGTKTVTVRKNPNVPQIINDSFNIPIQTLKAVSQLVGGLVKGVEGSVSASKSVSINVEASKH